MKNRMSILYIILAGILWGTIGIYTSYLNDIGYTTTQIVFVRSLGALIVFFVIILIKDYRLLKINIKDIWMFIGTGCISLFLFNYAYFNSIQLCSFGVASVLLYTAPIFVLIISAILFKEKPQNIRS